MTQYILNDNEKMLIEKNLKLAYWKAHKWAKILQNHIILDDLISCCEIGLINAVHSIDTTKKNKFATYANVCMDNQVKMYLRKNLNTAIPFSCLIYIAKDGTEHMEMDDIPDNSETPEDYFEKNELMRQLEKLPNKEYDIIFMYYYAGFTEHQIAKVMGYSQSYVSRLIKFALRRLHDILGAVS